MSSLKRSKILHLVYFLYREPVANFLRALCGYPGVDCYDLLTSISGIVLFINYCRSQIDTSCLYFLLQNNYPTCIISCWKIACISFFNHINYVHASFLWIQGKNCCLNASTVDLFLKNEPQSTSTKNMVHLAQSKSWSLPTWLLTVTNMELIIIDFVSMKTAVVINKIVLIQWTCSCSWWRSSKIQLWKSWFQYDALRRSQTTDI